MKTTGIFNYIKFEIPFSKYGEPIYLIPFGDVHRSAPLCHVEKWHEWIKEVEDQKNTWFIGMGDYDDLSSTSERMFLNNRSLHDSTKQTLDEMYRKHTDTLCNELSFMKGRLIGLLEGNHYSELTSGITTTQLMCEKLGCEYLGVSAFVMLLLKKDVHHTHRLDIWAHHGQSSGRTSGSSINKVEQMIDAADADIYCVSMDTQILTKDGWKNRPDISIGEKIYSFNNGQIEDDEIKGIVDMPCKKAIRLKNSNFDMLVSDNHRIIYKHAKDYLYKEAKDFIKMNGNIKIPLSGIYKGDGDKDICSLVGWIISEGHFRKSYTGRFNGIAITQKHKHKCKIIRECLIRNNIDFSEYLKADGVTSFYIKTKSGLELLKIISSKRIPEWMSSVGKECFDSFLDAMMLGDGHWYKGGNSGEYYSGDEILIDQLQHLCAIYGYRTKKHFKKSGFKDGCYALLITHALTSQIGSIKKITTIENYDGNMWCPQTRNTNFIARRNGNVFITGNCMGHDHKKAIAMRSRLGLSDSKRGITLDNKKIILARTGSFLKGYEKNKASYVADAGYSPSDLGTISIRITPQRENERDRKHHREDKRWLDLQASL